MRIRVFQADKGDCLLLTSSDNRHILVDGGLVNSFGDDAYSSNVAPTLGRMQRNGGRLDLVCVSHIDQDHIGGVLRLLDDHFDWRVFDFQTSQGLDVEEPRNPRPPEVAELWHNAFHEQVSKNRRAIGSAIAAAVPESLALRGRPRPSHGDDFMEGLATSMKEAAQLSRRIGAEQLGIPLNRRFGGRLAMKRRNSQRLALGNFRVSVIGPTGKQLIALRKKWNAWLRSQKGRRQIGAVRREAEGDEELLGVAELDEFLALNLLGPAIGEREDVTEANVASIVMLVEDGQKNILLTGDARDDHVLENLVDDGRTDPNGHVHLNVLKIQHHGSENNFSIDFGKHVTADHYVFCGNGKHENPDLEVVERLIASRIGPAAHRSPNAEVGNRFKLWFSADEDSHDADRPHMHELERLVRRRARKSRGQMRFRFNRNRSFSFSP